MAFNFSSLGKLIMSLFESPAAGADSLQINNTHTVSGGGHYATGMPSLVQSEFLTTNANRRSIKQNRSGVLNSHAVGDAAGLDTNLRGRWGMAAGADEGVSAVTGSMAEDPAWFHGTVSSATQTGGTPTLAFSSGAAYTIDGGYLLNISKGTLSGTLTGVSTGLSLTINSGSVATFLNKLPITGASLPVSTAIGIATAAISPAATTRNVPVAVTVTVNLAQIGGIFHLFTNGSVVSVAGLQQPEQAIVSGASGLLAGNQQTFTLHVTNSNTQAIIFQGGIQGNYISADANDQRSAYFAFGSLTGTDMIYGNQVGAGVANNFLPNLGCEKWTATGPNSAWHLYPGAEVTSNTDSGFACTVEQNGVVWTNGDVVECAPFNTVNGFTGFFFREQFTPSNPSPGMAGLYVWLQGPGISGGNAAGITVLNNYSTPANYIGSGGPLQAINGQAILGQFANCIYIQKAPDASNNAVVFVQNQNTHGDNQTRVIELNWASGGQLNFDNSTHRWHMDNVDANAFSVGGVAGFSGTVSPVTSITVVNGLVTAVS